MWPIAWSLARAIRVMGEAVAAVVQPVKGKTLTAQDAGGLQGLYRKLQKAALCTVR